MTSRLSESLGIESAGDRRELSKESPVFYQ